jgi:hypothetical protein
VQGAYHPATALSRRKLLSVKQKRNSSKRVSFESSHQSHDLDHIVKGLPSSAGGVVVQPDSTFLFSTENRMVAVSIAKLTHWT